MKDRIVVVMSLYKNDRLEFVQLAVESVLNQTYSNFDFFIQYDGPINKDVDIYLTGIRDERIKIQRRSENKGLAHSLNDLLKNVMRMGYKYIARMDADDISEPNRFERQMDYFEEHPEVECLGTWAREIKSDDNVFFEKQMPESHDECRKLFRKRDCVIHPTVMFRHSFFDKAGLYPTDTYFCEDTMMWAQGFAAGCIFGNVPEYLYRFRIDDNFFSRRRGWIHAKNIYQLRHKINKMLNYGIMTDIWAIAYAGVKLMPTSLLKLIYKTIRKA